MTSDRWEQINRIWQAAVETEEKRRASFLDEACREDSELRREVESLLAMQAQADGFLEKPAVEEVVKAIKEEPPSLLGRKLGPYQILAALGAGGMGEVYKARDTRLNRTVAIKVLPRSCHSVPICGSASSGKRAHWRAFLTHTFVPFTTLAEKTELTFW